MESRIEHFKSVPWRTSHNVVDGPSHMHSILLKNHGKTQRRWPELERIGQWWRELTDILSISVGLRDYLYPNRHPRISHRTISTGRSLPR